MSVATALKRMRGGLRLRRANDANALPILTLPLPPQLVIALDPHGRGLPRPCVTVGERVLRGQRLAAGTLAGALPVFASSSGTVVAIEARPVAAVGGGHAPHAERGAASSTCVVIDTDGSDAAFDGPVPASPGTKALPDWIAALRDAGLSGLGGAGFPAWRKMRAAGIDTLVVNGAECEPPIRCDEALMRDTQRAARVVAGIDGLLARSGASRALIGIEADRGAALATMQAAAAGEPRIAVVAVPARYPQGDARQLIRTLTGRAVPSDGTALDVGVLAFNVATVAAMDALWTDGALPVSRLVSVGGRDGRTQVAEVRYGTPWAWVLAQLGLRAEPGDVWLQGGRMMGTPVATLAVPVTPATNAISFSTEKRKVAEAACIRCGDCASVCPSGLQPQLLHWARGGDAARLAALRLADCTECACCDAVCPSHIPLAGRFAETKRVLAAAAATQAAADAAKLRYEARERRLAQEAEAERERLAQRTAEAAKAATAPKAPAHDPVAAALARVRARKTPPPVE